MVDINTPPKPDTGWSKEICLLENAKVIPPTVSALVQEAGVLDSNGEHCEHGALWRGARAMTVAPKVPEENIPIERLSGNWLYAGVLWVHFGHFLAESTSRLWAIDKLKSQLDGIIFIPKRPAVGEQLQTMNNTFMELLGCDLPIKVINAPTEVERLHVPGQGFGLGPMVSGTDEFRSYIHNNFGSNVEPNGPEKLYISRSALSTKKGGIIGEEYLENYLLKEGYEIFHPQKHDMPTQIAHYKAARKIIALDGSALHLFGFVGTKDQHVAMIPRRTSNVHKNISKQLEVFCGRTPFVPKCMKTDWIVEARGRPDRKSVGELNMERLSKKLARYEFISENTKWESVFWRRRNRAIRHIEKTSGEKYIPIHRENVEGK